MRIKSFKDIIKKFPFNINEFVYACSLDEELKRMDYCGNITSVIINNHIQKEPVIIVLNYDTPLPWDLVPLFREGKMILWASSKEALDIIHGRYMKWETRPLLQL